MAQNTEKAEVASVYSLCQGERGGPQNTELAVSEKLMLMAPNEEGREPSSSIECRPCGPHLLNFWLQRTETFW